ncbi:hypothetical protein DTO164E3_7212 [Paecilomyces variotii]|nr:hypothetical protein DTO164E3_7212 [Paecilomyces variotii]KAJ9198227.1 hypothetical protein DTO032I3_5643 [Paecilomyces variotii]KAJ9274883.1 hypothetical protein DTO021D3_8241 [Paecilomyces variotii]KAJ9344677.1 hypothetical protein DTO027B6_2859 [Paecilomyces variotii]KAJ9362556.1 hypothetical protein DTO027B9_233 [Paecilomyces variotii]
MSNPLLSTEASLLNQQEAILLAEGSGTKVENFTGTYAGSAKEPDWFMRPDSAQFPIVVIESGWSESHPNLLRDKDLWMNGNKTRKSKSSQTKFVCYFMLSGHRDRVYLTIATLSEGYPAYIREGVDDDETKCFLKLRCYGPFDVFNKRHVIELGRVALGLSIECSKA